MTAPPREIPKLRELAIERMDGIKQELMIATLNRQIYEAIRDEVVRLHPRSDATFLNSYSGVYARAQVMLIRRLADRDADVDSLWRLIARIRANPAIASRETVVRAVREQSFDDLADEADEKLSRRYSGGDVPPDALLAALQDSLSRELQAVVTFADRVVAHRDPRGPLQQVTYGDIHTALDHVIEISNEVNSILEYSTMMYSPIAIQSDWEECLRPGLFPIPPEAYQWPHPSGYV